MSVSVGIMVRCTSLLVLGLLPVATGAGASPAIIGHANDDRCRVALNLATAAFNAESFSLNWPIPQPARARTRIVLRQSQEDMSGGDAISADPQEFAVLSRQVDAGRGEKIYWTKGTAQGRRFALVDQPFNWEGDWYATYVPSAHTTLERFREQLDRARESVNAALKPALGDNRWSLPILLRDVKSGAYWLIDRGEPYQVMPDWRVYALIRSGLSMRCRISFGSPGDSGLEGMPEPVRKLAAALDEALGPGTGEGTLHQTPRIRLQVAKAWANAGLRPWARNEPYNTRSDVERGLAEWAKGNSHRARLLRQISSIYPAAEQALTSYYATHFKERSTSAGRTARRVLDRMFRSYFVFSIPQ